MKSLRSRFLLFILAPTLLFFIATSIYVSLTVHQMAVKDAEEMLLAQGESLAYELRLDLEHALSSSQALSNALAGVIEHGHTPQRDNVSVMLRQLLDSNPQAVSAWMFWDVNAFDGKDAEYANGRP